MDALACGWGAASFLIFSENVFAPLIYYSHLGPLIISLLIGGTVILNNPRSPLNRALFVMMAAFCAWVYFDLVLWASEKPELIMFFWSALAPVELLIYAAAWYLVASLARASGPTVREGIFAVATFVPVFILTHTSYNLLGFDYSNCDRAAIEGPLWQYIYIVELFFILWIAHLAFAAHGDMSNDGRRRLRAVGAGVVAFLTMFTAGNITLIFSLDWSIEQYKLFGMPVLAAFITYAVIRFRAFDLKVFTAQALVIALAILIFSLLFIRTIENVRALTVVTFALTCILGYVLIRSVQREIDHRELIEKQERELETVNRQQENLLHFISHEVKGYLAESEAGFASIVEGDFGAVPDSVRGMAANALSGVRRGVATVMDILDASNLKKGTMFFAMKPFDFRKTVEATIQDLRPAAEQKGTRIDLEAETAQYMLVGDEEKVRQHVVRNLIDNAIKYSPKGGIKVRLTDGAKIRFSVQDAGVGITPEDMKRLFTEGGRGKDSIKINVHSTGYGLFIARQVVDAHKGRIWAESAGEGKGSLFIVEFPLSS